MFKKLVLNMNFDFYLLLLLLLLSLLQLQCDARLSCEIKYSQTRLTYNVSNDAAAGIILSPGTGIDYMQVFHCTCPTNNEIFDDTEVTNVDRDFYQVNQFDWTQSQIFHINNCVTLTLSLRSGKNTFSNLLKGKLLIVENIQQLIMTAFSAGAPSVTTEDDVFSSIYFRNVTFYQIPPYFEFDDRYEVLFSNVYTDEGSNKIEPFDIRVKNSNFTRNPVFRMENSRFGGINVISDGYSFNVFSLTVQNLQLASNNSCNYDYHGSVRLVGNTFGYLRARNIYITNAMEFWFENNYVDLLNSNAFDLSNLKQTRFQNNIFGYELQDPVINLAYYRGGTGSCQSQDLPEQMVSMIDFSMNRVQRLETTFLNLRSDPNYSTGFINKINVNDIASTRPCNCTNPNIGFSPTDSQKLMSTAIQQSKCLSMHRVIGLRSDICSGKIPLTPEQEADRKARETRDNWLIYLIIAVAGTAIVVAILTAVCIKLCCKCKG